MISKLKNATAVGSFLFCSIFFYETQTPTLANQCVTTNEPAVTIENKCSQTAGYQNQTSLHIYTRGQVGRCQPSTDYWITVPTNSTCKLKAQNDCLYIVEPHGTIHSEATFSNNNAKIICEMEGLVLCKCRNK